MQHYLQRVGISGNCGRKTQSLAVHFDRELMKDCSSGSWDSCGMSLANVSSLCFICLSLCFIFSFTFISSESFLIKKGRIQCTALPWDSSHILCFLLLKRIHVFMPFSHSQTISPPHIFSTLIARLSACLASRNNLRLWVKFSAHAVPWPHTSQKTQLFFKHLHHIYLPSLKSVSIFESSWIHCMHSVSFHFWE